MDKQVAEFEAPVMDQLVEDGVIYAEDSELGAEFAEICGPHHDYLWDNIH